MDTPKPANPVPVDAPKGEPSLVVVPSDTVDLGTVPSDSPASFQFTLENQGTKPITIATIRPSCGCTNVSPVPNHPIAPHESITLNGVFNGRGYMGAIIKTIEIHTDDPARDHFMVHLRITVDAFVFPQPRFLVFSAAPGETTSQSFRFIPGKVGLKPKRIWIEPNPQSGVQMAPPAAPEIEVNKPAKTPKSKKSLPKKAANPPAVVDPTPGVTGLTVEWKPAEGGEIQGRVTWAPKALYAPMSAHLRYEDESGKTEFILLALSMPPGKPTSTSTPGPQPTKKP